MNCQRCQGCMARDHFLDMQESGGEWWTEGWRCINCGHVFDPVMEQNRRIHAAAMASTVLHRTQPAEPEVVAEESTLLDFAA